MSSRPSPAFARARRCATERLARISRLASLSGVALAALAPGAGAQAHAPPVPTDGVRAADRARTAPQLTGPVRLADGDTDLPFTGAFRAAALAFGPQARTPFLDGNRYNPVQADMDGDGDLDVLAGINNFTSTGRFKYFENTSGPATLPTFAAPVDNPFGLGILDGQIPRGYPSIALADMDADGDLDMVLGLTDVYQGGGVYQGNIYYVRNDGSATAPQFGYAIFQQGYDYAPNPTLGDLDGDGDNDLLLGTRANSNQSAVFKYRENTGSATAPSFAAAVPNPFGLAAPGLPPTVGVGFQPEFGDFDADGDLDIVGGNNTSNAYYYENTGTAAAPTFAAVATNPSGLAVPGNNNNERRFSAGDYDGDGDLDILNGDYSVGFLKFYPQIPAPPVVTPAQFAAPVVNPYGLSAVGGSGNSRMAAADLDADGDLDLYASGNGTNIRYYPNVAGPDATPAFAGGPSNPFGLQAIGGFASLGFEDLDGDGDLDMLAGSYGGNFQYQQNNGTVSVPAFAPIQTNPFGLTNVQMNNSPTMGDMDGDGDIDILAGGDDRNLRYFENTAGPGVTPAFAAPVVNPFGLTATATTGNPGALPTPTLGDLDGDGDLDVLVGERSSDLRYFENTAGPGATPAFAPVQVNPIGLVNFNSYIAFSAPDFADFDGDGDLDVISGESGGNFIFYQNTADPVSNTVTGTVAGTEGWRMLAAPVEGATLDDLLGFTHTQGFPNADTPGGTPTVFLYDESVGGSENNGYLTPGSQNDALTSGAGVWAYLFADDNISQPGVQGGFPKTLSVTGAQETVGFGWGADGAGALDYTDTGSGTDDGWNLLGNPFGSWMDWDAVELTDVDAPVYVYDDAAATYRTHVSGVAGNLPGGIVGPFQGFWVRASAPTAGLHARPAVANGGPTYRTGEAPTVVGLRLRPADGSALPARIEAQAFLALGVAGAADGRDRLDAEALASPAAQHLALAVGDARAIDARPEITAETTVEVSVSAVGADGAQPMVLDWPGLDLPDGWTARLLDRETGVSIVLADGGAYAFDLDGTAARDAQTLPSLRPSAADGRTTGRFALVVTPANLVDSEDAPTAASLSQAMPNPARGTARLALSVPSPERVRAAVYDALGREVAVLADGEITGATELRIDTARLAAGVYVVRVQGESFAETRRLTVVR